MLDSIVLRRLRYIARSISLPDSLHQRVVAHIGRAGAIQRAMRSMRRAGCIHVIEAPPGQSQTLCLHFPHIQPQRLHVKAHLCFMPPVGGTKGRTVGVLQRSHRLYVVVGIVVLVVQITMNTQAL